MGAMFANLTSADFRRPSQITIYNRDWTAVDYLMGELAIAGQRRERTLTNG